MTGNDLAEMEELRKRFHEEWKDLYEEIKGGRHSVREYCTALYHFLSKEKMQERLKQKENRFAETGMRDLEREYAQIYRVVINLLDKLVEILGEDIVSWRDFSQLLLAGFSQTKVGVLPGSQDQVLVGDMERTRLWAVKVLFFVGVNEVVCIVDLPDAAGFIERVTFKFGPVSHQLSGNDPRGPACYGQHIVAQANMVGSHQIFRILNQLFSRPVEQHLFYGEKLLSYRLPGKSAEIRSGISASTVSVTFGNGGGNGIAMV